MGVQDIDHRVDIYAVGVILYRAITGRYPFDGNTNNEVLYKISSGPFVPPRVVNPSIPEALEGIVLRAMARDPLKRYEDADRMRADLETTPLGDFARAVTPKVCRSSDGRPDGQSTKSAAAFPPLSSRRGFTRISSPLVLLLVMAAVSGYGFYIKSAPDRPSPTSEESTEQKNTSRSGGPPPLVVDAGSRVSGAQPSIATEALMSATETIDNSRAPSRQQTVASPPTKEKPAKRTSPPQEKHKKNNVPSRIQPDDIQEQTKRITGPLGTEISLDYDAYL